MKNLQQLNFGQGSYSPGAVQSPLSFSAPGPSPVGARNAIDLCRRTIANLNSKINNPPVFSWFVSVVFIVTLFLRPCIAAEKPGTPLPRAGDEIVAAGRFFHTGTPVVLWLDPGGYDAYRVERRFTPWEESDWETSKSKVSTLITPNRYGVREAGLTHEQLTRVRGGGWDLPFLQEIIDQFVIHFDSEGTSRECFRVLHDVRGLSVHFMLDVDGTIYQTLDLKERAFHATVVNTRSIGIEIAGVGASKVGEPGKMEQWYTRGPDTRIRLPMPFAESGIRTEGFVGRPLRLGKVTGTIQGKSLVQYDFTAEQYAALIKLTATLCQVFPKIKCDYPKDSSGQLITRKLGDEELQKYQGLLGHYHVQTNKIDPGPAFQWQFVVETAHKILQP